MKLYRCKKQFMLYKYDDDGFSIENEVCFVDVGDIYETCEDYGLNISNEPAIHLEKMDRNIRHWIEIYPDTLEEYFEEITDQSTEKGGEQK